MHNFVDTGWRKLGAFLLRALRVYIRGLVQWKSFEFHASHVIPSFFFLLLEISVRQSTYYQIFCERTHEI